jgi:hypothetical protein
MGNVKVYRSTDNGAPVLYGNAGYLIPILDACLVNGYGTLTPSSVTHSNGVVTVVTSVAHNLRTFGRQTIAGVANDTAYNGEFMITVTGLYTFTYLQAGITAATATGTITTKSTGAGWTKAFSGTNLAAYRPGAGSRPFLRIDDTTTMTCRCVGYETMSDVNTGTNAFPSNTQFAGGLYWQKSQTADITTPRDWIIIADDKTMYMWVNWNSSVTFTDEPMHGFGDYDSYKVGDAFNGMIIANVSGAIAGFRFSYLSTTVTTADTGMYLTRSYSQVGTSMPAARISDYSKSVGQANMGAAGMVYPHPTDGGLWMAPVWVCETAPVVANSSIRGVMRGVWNPLHTRPLAHLDTFQGSGGLTGKTFLTLGIQVSAQVMMDISMTW